MKIIHTLKLIAVLFFLGVFNSLLLAQDCNPDLEGPFAICNGLTVVDASETEETIITVDMVLLEATDNCDDAGLLQYSINIATGQPADPNNEDPIVLDPGVTGIFQVEVRVTDSSANEGLCWGTVQVGAVDECENDEIAPVAVCEETININTDAQGSFTFTAIGLNDGSYDNCTNFADLSFAVTLDGTLTSAPTTQEVEFIVSGEYITYLWVTDEAGNSNVCATQILINIGTGCMPDNTPPVAICDADIYIDIEAGDQVAIPATDFDDGSQDNCTATENLELLVTISPSTETPPVTSTLVFTGGASTTIPVFLWVIDEAGNSNICATNVHINWTPPGCDPDETVPFVVCNEVVNASTIPGVDFEFDAASWYATATDNCSIPDSLEFYISTDGSLETPPDTETLILPFDSEDLVVYTWVVDEAGNYSTCATQLQLSVLQGIAGRIFADSDGNCSYDEEEEGLPGFYVRYTLDQGLTYTTIANPSNDNGLYNLTFDWNNSPGEITVELIMPDGLGNNCVTSHTYDLPFSELQFLDFPLQLATDCDYMYTDISAPFLRRCFPTPYTASYCNYSSEAVDNVELTVTLDPAMVIDNVSLPYIDLGNNVLLFDLGTVEPGDCGLIDIVVILDCNTELGATKCVQSSISPNDCNDPGLNWSGASLVVNGECDEEAGKVNFSITNEGTGTMAEPLAFIVVEDVVMYMQTPIQLDPNESEPLEFDANGSTWRVAIAQEAGHPSLSSPTAFVEGCGGYGSTGMANQFAMDDLDPYIAIDCQEVIAAYDPNDKRAFPEGYSEQHFIEPNTSIEYNIRFQNTGTDTAFTVRIEDQLSILLDETSIEAGASSHPYRMEVQEDGLLIFHFDDIMLPDSNVNEIASHGFVQFRVNQKPDNQLGMLIENTAEIYFDFNEEIVTNTVFHTLGTNFIISETNEVFVPNLDLIIAPNPFNSKATFTLKGVDISEGMIELYDVFGRMVKQDEFSGNQYELDRENLPIGTYFFRFLDADNLLVNGKIIVK